MNHDLREPLLAEWLNDGPDRGSREGLELALAAARTVSQRPAWTFVERWLPMSLAIGRIRTPRLANVALLVVLVALILALAVALVGSRPRPPAPIGPAANGLMAFEGDGGIYLARVDGSERRKISGDIEIPRSPEFSHDGTRLAMVAAVSGGIDGPLFVVPTDGSRRPVNVSGDIVVASAYYPAISWSPDDRHIAFGGNYQGVTSIVVAASDGSGTTIITDRSAVHDLPTWSPDGRWIAYRIVQFDRASRSLAIAHPDGTGERILTSVSGTAASLSIARWSPDGTRLAFHRTGSEGSRAFVIDLTGDEMPLWAGEAGAFADTGIPWSPDGRLVALMTDAGVEVVDLDGNAQRLGPVAFCWVEWSPDGTALYGPSGDHCGGRVNVIPIADPGRATTSMEGVLSWQRVAP